MLTLIRVLLASLTTHVHHHMSNSNSLCVWVNLTKNIDCILSSEIITLSNRLFHNVKKLGWLHSVARRCSCKRSLVSTQARFYNLIDCTLAKCSYRIVSKNNLWWQNHIASNFNRYLEPSSNTDSYGIENLTLFNVCNLDLY